MVGQHAFDVLAQVHIAAARSLQESLQRSFPRRSTDATGAGRCPPREAVFGHSKGYGSARVKRVLSRSPSPPRFPTTQAGRSSSAGDQLVSWGLNSRNMTEAGPALPIRGSCGAAWSARMKTV